MNMYVHMSLICSFLFFPWFSDTIVSYTWILPISQIQTHSASEMTYIVSGGPGVKLYSLTHASNTATYW